MIPVLDHRAADPARPPRRRLRGDRRLPRLRRAPATSAARARAARPGSHFAGLVGHWELRGYGMWGVEETATGGYVGQVGLYDPEGWIAREIGWWVAAPSTRARASPTRRRSPPRRYAYQIAGWREAFSVIDPDNVRSIRLAERLGAVARPHRHRARGRAGAGLPPPRSRGAAMIPVLTTERLTLRAPRLDDFEASPPSSPPIAPASSAAALALSLARARLHPRPLELRGYGMWGVEVTATGALRRPVGLTPRGLDRPEIAWWIASPEHEGKGFAFEAAWPPAATPSRSPAARGLQRHRPRERPLDPPRRAPRRHASTQLRAASASTADPCLV